MQAWKWSLIFLVIFLIAGCAGHKVETRPDSEVLSLDVPRLDVSPDPDMHKVLTVVKKFGKMTMKHMSYEQYQKSPLKNDSAFSPEVFYDRYVLDLNEKNNWVTLTFYTAVRAIEKDPRIERLLGNFAPKAVDVKMKVPSGKTYLLSDSNADGVLEFASPAGVATKNRSRVDLQLLKCMQGKYHWILGIVKQYYRL